MKQSLTSAYENGSLGISECWDFLAGVWPESESFSDKGLGHVPKESEDEILEYRCLNDHNCLYVGVLESWNKVLHFKEAVFIYKSLEDLKAAFKHLIWLEEGFEDY
ncbi:unnamed protein product [Prunus armeniaca]